MIGTALLALLLAAPAPAPAAPGAAGDARQRAEALYDQGRYDEARPILESLDREGKTDGPLLYRLSFLQRLAGEAEAERATLERALDLLERAAAKKDTLETSFYLANALRNLGRPQDAAQVAAAATGRIESKAWPEPTDAVDLFRIGKLYQDQEKAAPAAAWFTRAAAGLAKDPSRAPAYLAWARRFAGQVAHARGDHAEAERQFAALTADAPTAADLDALASARARQKKWGAAAEAWTRAEKLDPAAADRPRYCARLALQAEQIGTLPAAAPDGRPWGQLTKEEMEAVLAAQAARGRELRALSPAPADAAAELARARALFVAAALEYALRRFPIRETAFSGGYAPLIFHADQWTLAAPTEGN